MFMKHLQKFFIALTPCKNSNSVLKIKLQELIVKYEISLEAVINARPEVEYSAGYLQGQENQLEATIEDLKEILNVMDE